MRERTRVARDIHDGLGHHLTVVGMQVQAAQGGAAHATRAGRRPAGQAEDQARQALTSVRESVAALREPRPAQPLSEQLRTLAAERAAAGLAHAVDVDGVRTGCSTWMSQVALYRAAQEGSDQCPQARERPGGRGAAGLPRGPVSLEIRDDGRGLGPRQRVRPGRHP